MACNQVVGNAEAYHEQNKDVVNEGEKKVGSQTAGQINNKTLSPLIFSTSKDWSGKVKIPYPGIIGDVGKFVHASLIGVLSQSDEAAVVYATNKSNYGWLLAWSVPGYPIPDGAYNKVYVEAGPVENLTKWDDIKAKLELSGSESYFVDTLNGSEMYGNINPVGSHAELTAIYTKNRVIN